MTFWVSHSCTTSSFSSLVGNIWSMETRGTPSRIFSETGIFDAFPSLVDWLIAPKERHISSKTKVQCNSELTVKLGVVDHRADCRVSSIVVRVPNPLRQEMTSSSQTGNLSSSIGAAEKRRGMQLRAHCRRELAHPRGSWSWMTAAAAAPPPPPSHYVPPAAPLLNSSFTQLSKETSDKVWNWPDTTISKSLFGLCLFAFLCWLWSLWSNEWRVSSLKSHSLCPNSRVPPPSRV